jgi:molybdopterin-containing oxidoreductase family membrane subunit
MTDPTAPGVPGDALEEHPLIVGRHTDRGITESLLAWTLQSPGKGYWALLGLLGLGSLWLLFTIGVVLVKGVGVMGINIPVAWGFAITDFVWWIGIGHAGTLISAILLLLQQKWRSSINRFAEAMTLFAVMMAGLFPLLHLGRPWFFYWLAPYPSVHRIWPQFRSSLPWDVVAVSTYFTVSLLFWYLGLVPDLATARDAATSKWRKRIYGIACLGWRGSGRHWHHWRIAYLLLGGLATPLVVSVHTIVSFDFSIAQLPGWHTTIFPPYFVAGAIFSGFAMVLTLILPARKVMGLEKVITLKHVELMNKILLVTGLMVAYGYVQEHFIGWYSHNPFESYAYFNKRFGPYAFFFWLQVFCNVLVPQVFWIKKARTNVWLTWIASILVNVGMWTERFTIVVPPLGRDYLPSSWAMFFPTWVDWSLLFGSMCLFGTLFLLFLKYVPAIPISETKELQEELEEDARLDAELARLEGRA